MVKPRVGVALFAAVLCAVASPAGASPCADRLLPAPAAGDDGPVTARSLLELRDFGRSDSGPGGMPPFSVSPDGKWAALILRQANPDTDDYCIGVVLVPLDGARLPRLVDTGGELIVAQADIRGVADIINGSPQGGAPVWSPDSRAVAYLRRDHGVTQVWRASLDGRSRQLTRFASDARDISWPASGLIEVATRPSLDAEAAIAREGRRGFLYDRRFWAISDARPRPLASLRFEWHAIDAGTGEALDRSAPPVSRAVPSGTILFAESGAGYRAWTAPEELARFGAPAILHVSDRGRPVACPPVPCGSRVAALWFRRPGELVFLRAGSADNGGRVTLFHWRLGRESEPRLVLDTQDALIGCVPAGDAAICAHESSLRPRTLVRLDPGTGSMTTLFDPNPDFARRRLGRAERLRWTDGQGIASYGDLVLPPGHKPGERHPLIVVQYTSQGFLRGGVGDEYPIQLFAARGYAVMSIQRPVPVARSSSAADLNAYQRINVTGWADRRRLLAGVEAGIDMAIARGVIDSDRVGITGLSDGAGTVQFAMINSRRFRAAALSSCCESQSVTSIVGPAYGEAVRQWGYPPAGVDNPDFWKPYSLAANAGVVRTPLLMQLADSEYRMALETYAALEHAQSPVEMYVFPGEHHVKIHPAHRLAIYERNLAWFDFWLRGIASPGSQDPETLQRWLALKARAR